MKKSINNPNIVIFASKSIGLNSIVWLLKKNYPISAIFFIGNYKSEVKKLCNDNNIFFFTLNEKNIDNYFNKFKTCNWLLSLWNPYIFSERILKKCKNTLNMHPSYLPYCRGADTAAWTIIKNYTAGVSLITINKKIDTGKIWAQKKIKYQFPISGHELYNIMQIELIELFKKKWNSIYSKKIKPQKQKNILKAYTRLHTNKNKLIKSSRKMKVKNFINSILAHDFKDTSSALIEDGKKIYKITLNLKKII